MHKVSCFVRMLGTAGEIDNLKCEIIYDDFTCESYHFSTNHRSKIIDAYFILLKMTVIYIKNRKTRGAWKHQIYFSF